MYASESDADLTAGTTAVRIHLLSCGHVVWVAQPVYGAPNHCLSCNRAATVEHYIDEQAIDAEEPVTLGGFPVPDERDERGWRDLAEQRAAAEGIEWPTSLAERRDWPSVADFEEVADILDRHGITPEVIAEHIAAEQAAFADGTVKPIRRH